jgi:ankyrin repeat protein
VLKIFVFYDTVGFMIRKSFSFVLLSLIFVISLAANEGDDEEFEIVFPTHAIINASYRGDEGMVRTILSTGTDKDVRDALGSTALHAAMYQSNLMVIKLLLDNGFDPNARDTKHGHTPLHNAVAANNVGAARMLLQYRADKNIKSKEGLTPLDKARKEEKRDMVMLLYR